MQYNVINYSNQVIGQLEADSPVEAWAEAGKKYENVLDVRLVEVKQVITPIVKGISSITAESVYNSTMLEQIYTWDDVVKITPRSSHDAIMFVAYYKYLKPLSEYNWKFTTLPLVALDYDLWISTLGKYGVLSSQEMYDLVMGGLVPPKDMIIIYPDSEGIKDKFVAERLSRDISRLHEIEEAIFQTGVYYPPIVGPQLQSLDGAHRMATLYHLFGPNFTIYVWVAQEK